MWKEMETGASGGEQTIKDICKNALTNSSFTQYSLSDYSSRATIHEGGVAVDSTNSIVYLYADFTTLVASQPQNNTAYAVVTNATESISPINYNGSRGAAALITDEASSIFRNFICYPYSSTQVLIMNPSGQSSIAIGNRIIVYGAWSFAP